MFHNPWKIKGIVLTAPQPYLGEVPLVAKFIEEVLVPAGVNMIVLQIRYRYQFKKHPECQGFDPLSYDDVKLLLDTCRRHNIKLVPKMNLLGHQSGIHRDFPDGILHGLASHQKYDFPDALLRAYPFLEEDQTNAVYDNDMFYYSKHICPTHPLIPSIMFDLIDEILDVFESDMIHIGCDECWGIGSCERCKGKSVGELLANYVNMINDHLKARNAQTMIWSDRLIDAERSGYNDMYESSYSGADEGIKLIDKDIICCDWHYTDHTAYTSVDMFADAGLKMMISPWNEVAATGKFLDYAKNHDKGHILGYLQTTWCSSGELARHYLYGEDVVWEKTKQLLEVLDEHFL